MRCALLAILLLVPCGVAAQQQPSLSDVRAVLGPLIETYGVSGMEGPVREAVTRMLPSWTRATTDSAGDLIVSVGEGEPLVRLSELNSLLPQLSRMGVTVQLVTSAVRPIPAG